VENHAPTGEIILALPELHTLPSGDIVAVGISGDDFMAFYEGHYEWVRGYVIRMSPVTARHDDLTTYLRDLLRAYFALRPLGLVRGDPFVQRIDAVNSRRQPDLQVILRTNPGQLTETAMIGPADICIEVVSSGSVRTDYGDKFEEYERGGVAEYWLFDPLREQAFFYRRGANGLYQIVAPDADGHYTTPLLPGLRLHVPTLWADELPDILAVVEAVRAMLAAP
jgi:Uma2 family endonuclease